MTERSEKPVRSGISKAQSATDGNSLYWTWEYPTVHLCLIASCSLFLQQKQTKSILQYTQLHEYHKAAHTVSEVRYWHSGHNGHSAQNTQLNNFSHLLSTLMHVSLKVLFIAYSYRHAHITFTHNSINSEGGYLLAKVKRNSASYYRLETMRGHVCVLSMCVLWGRKISGYVFAHPPV